LAQEQVLRRQWTTGRAEFEGRELPPPGRKRRPPAESFGFERAVDERSATRGHCSRTLSPVDTRALDAETGKCAVADVTIEEQAAFRVTFGVTPAFGHQPNLDGATRAEMEISWKPLLQASSAGA
jgi:hypothetical protein